MQVSQVATRPAPRAVSVHAPLAKRTFPDRVFDALTLHPCTEVWVRGAGLHVFIGRGSDEPFARVTALGGGSYALSFRGGVDGKWEPLLVDDLRAVVEHALIGGNEI